MNKQVTPSVARLIVVMVGITLAVIAYLRGNYLLGFNYGLAYAFIAVGLVWMSMGSFAFAKKPSWVRAVAIGVLSIPIGYVMAFPASINRDIQVFIDKQADDRTARAELRNVFASDAAFANLSISTVHLKVVNVTISGSFPDRAALDRLRNRIATECPTAQRCPLHWKITLRATHESMVGLDGELFASRE